MEKFSSPPREDSSVIIFILTSVEKNTFTVQFISNVLLFDLQTVAYCGRVALSQNDCQ